MDLKSCGETQTLFYWAYNRYSEMKISPLCLYSFGVKVKDGSSRLTKANLDGMKIDEMFAGGMC